MLSLIVFMYSEPAYFYGWERGINTFFKRHVLLEMSPKFEFRFFSFFFGYDYSIIKKTNKGHRKK